MNGINNYFNEPMMIDQTFLMSVLSSLAFRYKNNSFESSEHINQKFIEGVNAQMTTMVNQGATQFPVMINIVGPIIKYSDWYYTGTQTILNICKRLEADERVSGVLFNFDSGGGMGDGTPELADYIFNMEKPTVAFSNGNVCSAALYLFAACKKRVMSPFGNKIGSKGVYIPYSNYEGIFEKLGAVIKDIYAPDSSLKNFAWREMVKNKNPKPFEDSAKAFNAQFTTDIKRFYGDKLIDDGKVFEGEVYSPQEALAIGLVDELTTLELALSENF